MEYFQNPNEEESSVSAIRVLGFALLIVGIAMCVWVFIQAVHLFNNPNEAQLFERILPFDAPGEITIDGEPIVLPEEFYYFLAYFATIFTLAIAGFIGGAFLSGGVSLINPSGEKLEKRIERRMREVEAKIEHGLRKAKL